MVEQKSSPYSGFNFTIEFGDEWGNSVVGGFEEIEGLSAPRHHCACQNAWSA
jgi:hypothetical protein